ncbi:MAG: hypothetical protein HGB11_07120 [Chlorobiales bacterium]|nr:hypothetical protein [Chlorobiales bacterium]
MYSRLKEYEDLLGLFTGNGYNVVHFSETHDKKAQLLLRHDIDFDVKLAYEMSLIEDVLGVKATCFFMVRSNSYNLFSPENVKLVRSIKERGHKISIHFDPTIYEDFIEGFCMEVQLFEKVFEEKVDCISIHRPIQEFLSNDNLIGNVRHTYQSLYFKEIKYFADSQGQFRFGSPIESEAFTNGDTIHLLIHPIWWVTSEVEPVHILNKFLNYRITAYQQHMAYNCKPYSQFLQDRKNEENSSIWVQAHNPFYG